MLSKELLSMACCLFTMSTLSSPILQTLHFPDSGHVLPCDFFVHPKMSMMSIWKGTTDSPCQVSSTPGSFDFYLGCQGRYLTLEQADKERLWLPEISWSCPWDCLAVSRNFHIVSMIGMSQHVFAETKQGPSFASPWPCHRRRSWLRLPDFRLSSGPGEDTVTHLLKHLKAWNYVFSNLKCVGHSRSYRNSNLKTNNPIWCILQFV